MYPEWNLDDDAYGREDEHYNSDNDYLAALLGKDLFARLNKDGSLDDVARLFGDADDIRLNLGAEGARGEAAKKLIERLVPTMIDVELWWNVARGKHVHLPASDQYG